MKKARLFIFLVAVLCGLTSAVYGQVLSSQQMVEMAKDYDGRELEYEGEVVGDIMYRGGYAWLSINDGYSSIGVWCPTELAKGIISLGGPSFRGDIVRVRGIFHRACNLHGGDLDIHAVELVVLSKGHPKSLVRISKQKVILSLFFCFLTAMLGLMCMFKTARISSQIG